MAEYKIGTFAKNLGVTSSLLKHYEKYHLIKSKKNNLNGYRYYCFTQTPTILRIKQLQKLGFTLREIAETLHNCTPKEMNEKLEQKIEDIHSEILKKQLALKEAIQLQASLVQICQEQYEGNWTIEQTPSIYFLPHSNSLDFVDLNDNESEQLKNWMEHFPLTKQAVMVNHKTHDYQYGLAIEQQIAHQLQLDMQYPKPMILNGGKALIYPVICTSFDLYGQKYIERLLEKPLRLLANMGIEVNGPIYIETIIETTVNQKRAVYYQICVPLNLDIINE